MKNFLAAMPRARSQRIAIILALAAILWMVVVFFFSEDDPKTKADELVSALLRRDWHHAYDLASDEERARLGWDATTFSRFADALATKDWPSGRRILTWYVPAGPTDAEMAALRARHVVVTYAYNPHVCRRMQAEVLGEVRQRYFGFCVRRRGRRWYPDLIETMVGLVKTLPSSESSLERAVTAAFDRACISSGVNRVAIFPLNGSFTPQELDGAQVSAMMK